MVIVGLTGSIGMGKSTAAERFRHNGIAVFDADACVHELYSGRAIALIEEAFPGTTSNGRVDRQKLASALLEDREGFKRLENIVHPLVREEERKFLHQQAEKGAAIAVLEVPLLFESGADALVDAVVVVSADSETQAARVMQRPGMTREKMQKFLSLQMPDAEKRARADFVVDTSGSLSQSRAQLDSIVLELRQRQGQVYQRHWV
jgi:dephospho-CoA kinase